MRTVVAYDASAGAEDAATLVLGLPWPAGSAVRVVAVVEPTGALVPAVPLTASRLVASPEIDARIVEHLQEEVRRLVGRLRSSGLEADGDVLRGRPATVLIDEARSFGADLVVAGSRGHGPIASLVLGSVAAELVDHAPCPVLIARGPSVRNVLLASDGSTSARGAEDRIARWPIFAGASVRVLSVGEVARPWHTGIAPTLYRQVMEAYARDLEGAKAEHEALAAAAAARLRGTGLDAEGRMRIGDAATEVIEEASAWPADLVVLGSRGLTGLARIVLGSVARNVLQGSPSSVLVVRETAPGA